MKKLPVAVVLAAVAFAAAAGTVGTAAADPGLRAGFGARAITPVGPSPAGQRSIVAGGQAVPDGPWNFWSQPTTQVWGEPFTDANGNGCWDIGEAFEDDPRNTAIDPGSANKWDGIWTNAGFGARCALGKFDDTWARAVVVEAGGAKVALVSLDVVGFFEEEIARVDEELDARFAGHGIDKVVVSSTHTHEGPDTMGLWGGFRYNQQTRDIPIDGKFPLYQAFIRSQIVDAIAAANDSLQPAKMKVAETVHTAGIRDSRAPNVIDPYLQAAQFVALGTEETLGTLVVWSNHPEALASGNPYISSDFPHGTRQRLEQLYGGTAVYFSGSVGGLMTPLGVDMGPGYGTAPTTARAYYIGTLVADAAKAALDAAPFERPSALTVASKTLYMQGDNQALRAINAAGVFDKPTYAAPGVPAGYAGEYFKTEMVTVGVGRARFVTVPGELFPEIEIGGYGRPDCPAANTGRPYEPVIRQQYTEPVVFVLGLAQDELGYIVPGYDFWQSGHRDTTGVNTPGEDAARPVVGVGGLAQRRDPCGVRHYEETVSASSVMAPIVACTAAELAGRDPWNDSATYPACTPEHTTVGPQGLHLEAVLPR